MNRISLAFFTAAAICGVIGMGWGMQMGIIDNFAMKDAHAHLNLVGWVSLALMGAAYGVAGDRASAKLGWANFILSAGGVAIQIPSLAILLAGDNKINPGAIIGSILALLGMLAFLVQLLLLWRSPRATRA